MTGQQALGLVCENKRHDAYRIQPPPAAAAELDRGYASQWAK